MGDAGTETEDIQCTIYACATEAQACKPKAKIKVSNGKPLRKKRHAERLAVTRENGKEKKYEHKSSEALCITANACIDAG